MTNAEKVLELQNYILFKGFSTEELEIFADTIEVKHFSKGEYLFYENDTSKEVYLIRSGKVEVLFKNRDTREFINSGDIVGELAMVDGSPRSNSVVCVEDTVTFVLEVAKLPLTLTLLMLKSYDVFQC